MVVHLGSYDATVIGLSLGSPKWPAEASQWQLHNTQRGPEVYNPSKAGII